MIKYRLVFLIVLMTFCGYAQSEKQYAEFFDSLSHFQFEEAQTSIIQFDEPNKNLTKSLATLLYNEGQIPFKLDIEDDANSLKIETKFLDYLVKGYYSLFYEPQKKVAFENFYEAYRLSSTLNEPNFTKASLLALLKYYSYEIAQNDKAHLKYLNEYRSFFKNDELCYWGELYDTIFLSKGLNGVTDTYFEKEAKLKEIIDVLDSSSPRRIPLYFEIATLLDIKGDKEKAIEYYSFVVDEAGDLPYLKKQKFFAALKLALIYEDKKAQAESRRFRVIAEKSINLADTLRAQYYLHLFDAQINNSKGDFQSAYKNLMSAYRLEFDLDYRKNSFEVNRLQVELDTAEKEKQILVEQQRAHTNRNWLIAASLALLFGAGIAILLQKNSKKKRQLAEKETQLKQERVDNLLKGQELMSIDAMIAGQEKERQRVANELHDDLGSLMATIKLHFDNSKISKKDPGLQSAEKLLEEAYQKVRTMAHSKNSGVMSSQGLLPAIKKMAQVITETNALTVNVEDFGMGERLENSLELSLFRTIQELVANAIKHADATNVNIQLTQHEDILNIIVEDNGNGFDRSKLDIDSTGMGLTNIEKRIEHLEGNFTVDSVLGKGTSILIDIPV